MTARRRRRPPRPDRGSASPGARDGPLGRETITTRIAILTLSIVALAALVGCSNAGEEVTYGDCSLHDEDPATGDEAQKVGPVLQQAGYFAAGIERDVQLVKSGEEFVVRFVVEKDRITPQVEQGLGVLRGGVSQALGGARVRLEFCDARLETIESS